MNKQFSPFLQRYFLTITEVICNQIRKYRDIFKSNQKPVNWALVKQLTLLPLFTKNIPVELLSLNMPFKSKGTVCNLNTDLRIQWGLYCHPIFNWATITSCILRRYLAYHAVINGYIFYKKIVGNCRALQNAIQSNVMHREPSTGVV